MGSGRSRKIKPKKADENTLIVAKFFRENYELPKGNTRAKRLKWIRDQFDVGDSMASKYHSWALQHLKSEAKMGEREHFLDSRATAKRQQELNEAIGVSEDDYKNGEIDPHQEIIKNHEFLQTVTKGIRGRQFSEKVKNSAAKELVNMYKDFGLIIKSSNKKSIENRLYKMLKRIADRLNIPSKKEYLKPDVDRLKQFTSLWQPFNESFEFDPSINEALQVFIENRQSDGQMHDRVSSVCMMNRVLAKPEFRIYGIEENEILEASAERMKAVFGLGEYETEECKNMLLGGYWRPFQKRWIQDRSRQKISEKSRRTGYTFASSFEWNLEALVMHGDESVWISRSEKLAKQFAKKYLMLWTRVVNDVSEQNLIHQRFITAGEVMYPNGHQIIMLSSNPDAAAGYGGKVGMDEFALHQRQEDLYDIASPMILYGDRLQIISTHRGRDQFWQFIQDSKEPNSPWSRHRCTIKDAIADGLVQVVNNERVRKGFDKITEQEFYDDIRNGARSEQAFLQEYMCEPADDINAILTYDLIRSCLAPEDTIINKDGTGRQYFGYDFGLTVNPSVMLRLEETNDGKLILRDYKFVREKRFRHQRDMAIRMMDKCHKGVGDAGAQGSQMMQELEEEYKNKFEGIMLTGSTTRAEIANLIWRFFDEGRIVIPDNDEIIEHLFAMKKEEKEGKQPRIYSEGTSNKDDHADFFWALGMALWAHGGYVSEDTILRRLPRSMRASSSMFEARFW